MDWNRSVTATLMSSPGYTVKNVIHVDPMEGMFRTSLSGSSCIQQQEHQDPWTDGTSQHKLEDTCLFNSKAYSATSGALA